MPTNAEQLISLAKEAFPDVSAAEESFLILTLTKDI
jgi:hypothetical protein